MQKKQKDMLAMEVHNEVLHTTVALRLPVNVRVTNLEAVKIEFRRLPFLLQPA